ncbi:MAG: hypothetical protein ACRYFS_23235 [Janthinobacterium lividum]
MKRFLIAFAAACILGLSITAIIVMVHTQRVVTRMQQFAADGPANLAREEAADRQLGMLLGPDQMQAPLPPASQNAAPLYTKLTVLLKQKPLHLPRYADGMDAFHTYTPAQIALVRETLAQRTDVMDLVHQAADRPKCVFARDWSQGADIQFPEYRPMRKAVWLLKTESYLLARDGHFQKAITNQTRGFRVAEHAASDPVLLAHLLGIACDHITLSGMQSILAIAGPNRDAGADMQRTVELRQPKLSLRRAMAGESGFGCACIIKMHQAESRGMAAALTAGGLPQDPDSKINGPRAEPQNLHGLIDAWQADYLAHMRPLVVACDMPPLVRRTAFAAAEKQLEREEDNPSNPTHLVALILMPAIGNNDENDTRAQTRQIVTQVAAALLSIKAQNGIYPETLPQSFVDPFTGKPLGYRREGVNGFVVYSAGPTGTFDGGKPGQKVTPQDSVFRYPAVPLPLSSDMLK